MTARENGLNPFEYIKWILENAPNLGKASYARVIEELLPGSASIPQKVYSPKPRDTKAENHAWEEEENGSEH